MQQRPLLRRALAHAEHFLHTLRPGVSPPASLPAPAPIAPLRGTACPGLPVPTTVLPDAQAAADPAEPVTAMPLPAPAPAGGVARGTPPAVGKRRGLEQQVVWR